MEARGITPLDLREKRRVGGAQDEVVHLKKGVGRRHGLGSLADPEHLVRSTLLEAHLFKSGF